MQSPPFSIYHARGLHPARPRCGPSCSTPPSFAGNHIPQLDYCAIPFDLCRLGVARAGPRAIDHRTPRNDGRTGSGHRAKCVAQAFRGSCLPSERLTPDCGLPTGRPSLPRGLAQFQRFSLGLSDTRRGGAPGCASTGRGMEAEPGTPGRCESVGLMAHPRITSLWGAFLRYVEPGGFTAIAPG